MSVDNLIIDPQVSSNLSRRMITSQVMQRKAPRIVILNPEYMSDLSTLKSEDILNLKFLRTHEMLLTKENITSSSKFKNLVRTYGFMSIESNNPRYAEAFDSSVVGTILRLLDALSENDRDLLNELKFWTAADNVEEIVKHCDEANLEQKAQTPQDLKRFNNLLQSITEPAYQEMFNTILEMLYNLHQPFIKIGKVTSFDFLDSSKLIFSAANNVGKDTYMRALTIFAMLSKKAYVYFDSATPDSLLKLALSSKFNVHTVVLNDDSKIEFKRPFSNIAKDMCISMQSPDIDLLFEKLAQADSNLLKVNYLSKKAFSDYILNLSYHNTVGKYIFYNKKNDKITICTTNVDPLKRSSRQVFDTNLLKNKEENRHDQASEDEKINMPNTDKDVLEMKSLLRDVKNSLDKLRNNSESQSNSNSQDNNDSEILRQIKDLKTAIDKLKINPTKGFSFNRYRSHDIFGNPEDETDEDIDSALTDELSKQNPETKNDDPLQRHFMEQDNVESEMPNKVE